MIDKFSKLSKKIYWVKPIAYIMVVGFIGMFGYAIIFRNAGDTDVFVIPSILGVFWSLLLISFTSIFPNVPSITNSDEHSLKPIRMRLKRGIYNIIGLVFLILSVALIFISLKTLGIWREDYFS